MQDILIINPCKVILEDFDYKRDLNLRLYLETLTKEDISVLEEILYSPLKVSIEELSENTDKSTKEIENTLKKLAALGLFELTGDTLLINKEMRKYFEIFIQKFTEDFIPNLDYFREILKLVPIHCIVAWYHIPRTSNNIFNSILEKHLKTPKVYTGYIKETLLSDEVLKSLVDYVMESPTGSVDASEILSKFDLLKEELEEKVLFLEYHYILSSAYELENGQYRKYLTLFDEWKNWKQLEGKDSSKSTYINEADVKNNMESEFSFIQDMSLMLELCDKLPLKVAFNQKEELFFLVNANLENQGFHDSSPRYLARVINKNLLLGLIVIEEDELRQTPPAEKWLATPLKKRTLITFKHPHNSLSHKCDFSFERHDRNIIEVQKALSRIEQGTWMMFEEFIDHHLSTSNMLKQAELVKVGRVWRYESAGYDQDEIAFIKTVILDWLFESGMIVSGTYKDKDCFKVTSLGYELYS